MGTLGRRFVVLAALIFWQGGFTFYGSVVVPVARAVLQPPSLQGAITSRVTNVQNLVGAVALVVMAWDAWKCRGGSGRQRRRRWLAWGGMLTALGVLAWLHVQLDARIASENPDILRDPTFYATHRAYLWVGLVQWLMSAAFLWLTLVVWREEDGWLGKGGVEKR